MTSTPRTGGTYRGAPVNGGIVLATLIVVAAVASRSAGLAEGRGARITLLAGDVAGDQNAHLAGIVAILICAALVFVVFPRHDREQALLAEDHEPDAAAAPPATT